MSMENAPIRRQGLMVAAMMLVYCLWAVAPVHQASAQDKAAAPAAAPDAGAAPAAPQPENFLVWFIRTSGWIGAIILALSVYFVAQTITLFMEFRPQVAMPPAVVAQANELLDKEDFAGVYNVLKTDKSFYSRVLTAGMSELPVGLREAQEVLDRHGEAATVEMERKISMLAVLGTLGPMIGLLGTLKGMIASFSVIARSDQQMKASEVAGGISEALLLTFEGVALSVPAIYFYAFFRNRMTAIASTTMLAADEFLRKFYAKYKSRQRSQAAATKA
jgi:biopolymer transport protein ExbB